MRDGLIGRHVLVRGTAKREQIFLTNAGPRSGLYYYQTHIYVDSLDQIEILDGA